MIASAVRNTLIDIGTRLPSMDSTPSAKAMSVAVGMAQPRNAAGSARLKVDIDQRRHDHAAERADPRQHAPRPARQLPDQHLALDLEADQQEEDDHQAIVDPVQHAHAGELGMQGFEIEFRERRVGDDQGQSGRSHQDESTRRLAAHEVADDDQRFADDRRLDRRKSFLADVKAPRWLTDEETDGVRALGLAAPCSAVAS